MSIKKLCILLLLPACALAEIAEPTASASLPAEPATLKQAIAQQHQATAMRKEAASRRSAIEAQRTNEDIACLKRFLVNACRETVRENYIERISVVRQLEVDANQLDRVAKSRQLEIETANKQAPEPTARPLSTQSHPSPTPKPSAKPLSGQSSTQPAPSANVSPEAQAKADAQRAQRITEAERQKQIRANAAAVRASHAQKDAERYDAHQREHAEKMARKPAAASAPASKP